MAAVALNYFSESDSISASEKCKSAFYDVVENKKRKNLSSSSVVKIEKIDNSGHDDDQNRNEYDNESEGMTSPSGNSPPSFTSTESLSPISRVCPILMSSMMSVLYFAFSDSNNSADGVMKKSILRQIVTEKVIAISNIFLA